MDSQLEYLINFLLDEMPEYREDAEKADDRKFLLRSLMNLRSPMKELDPEFLRIQDEYLSHERDLKGIVDVKSLPEILPGISLWQGDITRLNADAIVNAANSLLMGCFIPGHSCIDNAIHSAAGLQLRDECRKLMMMQGHSEPNGRAKITKGYNLPCKYVLHTVGPIITGRVTRQDREDLRSCYRSCLELADSCSLESIAFCCVSTGEFHFPNEEAAKIAIDTVMEFMNEDYNILNHVIFNVFKDLDLKIYERELMSRA